MTTITGMAERTPFSGYDFSITGRARQKAPRSVLAGMMTVGEAARYVGLSMQSMYAYQRKDNGPQFYRNDDGKALYKIADLDAWKAGRA